MKGFPSEVPKRLAEMINVDYIESVALLGQHVLREAGVSLIVFDQQDLDHGGSPCSGVLYQNSDITGFLRPVKGYPPKAIL